MSKRAVGSIGGLAVGAGLAAYLHDPPWVARVTSGRRQWEEDAAGIRFRWTAGHGSFFVPGAGTELTLPLRAVFAGPGDPVIVNVSVDDRWLAAVELANPDEWRVTRFPLPVRPSRRYRRVDLRVSRVIPPYNLGVQVGDAFVR